MKKGRPPLIKMAPGTFHWLLITLVELLAITRASSGDASSTHDDSFNRDSSIQKEDGNSLHRIPLPNPLYLNDIQPCDRKQFAVIFVHSAPEHFKQRTVIRETWGSVARNSSLNTRVLFIIGLPNVNSSVTLSDIQKEYSESRDILLANLNDVYSNLTLKSVAMLDWINTNCRGVRYVIKSDDDTFINTPLLIGDLVHVVHTEFMMGDIIAGARPIRDRKSKYFTSVAEFSDAMYPTYLSGAAYVISGDIIPRLTNAAKTTELFWLEDVYITGILAPQTRVKHVYNRKFGFRIQMITPCRLQNIIALHRISPKEMMNAWTLVTKGKTKC